MKEKKNDFARLVYTIVMNIPRGKTLSYKQVAELAGSPGASRAVGTILKSNFNPLIPCHRVICANGKPGGYNRGAENKIRLLKEEGAL